MSRQGIVKRGILKQTLYLGAEMFTDISRGDGGLVSELGAPIYDSGDVFEIVAGQEVSMTGSANASSFVAMNTGALISRIEVPLGRTWVTAVRTASSYQRFPKPRTALSVGITSSRALPASQRHTGASWLRS